MPTYYLMRSGLLEKHGIKFEEFPVPSGNLTMQQMVARQVDLGTYAGQSMIIGSDKGGLVAIAQIEFVGRTTQLMARKDLGITTVEQLRGKKIANQTGSSIGNVFVDTIAPQHGLKKGDYQEVRMDVNNMVAALAAKTVDAMVNVEPYNAIAAADGIATEIMDFSSVDKMPLFMAATPDFVQKSPDEIVAYCKAWLDAGRDFKEQSRQGDRHDLRLLHRQGLHHVARHVRQGAGAHRRQSRLPGRPQALHAGAGGDPAAGAQDFRDPGLEQGAAAGIHGKGARRGVTDRFFCLVWRTLRCPSPG